MNKKKILIIVIAVLLVCLLGVGAFLLFGGTTENIAAAENIYNRQYSYTVFEQSEVTVDGVLDEPVWEGKKWWKNTFLANTNGALPIMELTAFPTEKGIIVGSVVYDSNLTSDGERMPQSNSNWELYFGAAEVGESLYDAENSGAWNVKKFFVDMYGGSATRYNGFDRAVKVEGELNSATTSATLEMFIPWETLCVDTSKGVPETIAVMPCYRAVLQVDAATSWMSPSASSLHNTVDMYLFDSTGYQNEDVPGSVLGDGAYGYAKTRGWDISQAAEGTVVSSYASGQRIYFSEQYGDNYIVEATIIPESSTSDPWPKTGFIFQKSDGQYHTVWLDPHGDNNFVDSVNVTKNFPDYQVTTLNTDGGWNQNTITSYDKTNPNATKQEGVKLTVIKYGDNFWYFADGKYLATDIVGFMDGDVMPGLWSLGMATIFKDCSCKAINRDELVSYLNEKSVYMIDASVDGPGGSVTINKESAVNGEAYQISITSKSGYRVASVQINGEEKYADVSANGNGGTYTVSNVQDNQNVVVRFDKCDEVNFTGSITDGEKAVSGNLIVTGITDKSLFYSEIVSSKKNFSLKLPAGTYQVRVNAEGYKIKEMTLELNENTETEIVIEPSDFAETIRVNGKNVKSELEFFDLSKEHEGIISASHTMGSSNKNLFFDGCGTDFVVQATIKYTTDFVDGNKYQPDVIAGFCFSDGTDEYVLWANDSGFVYWPDRPTGWSWVRQMNVFNKKVLMYPNPNDAVFSVAKLGEDVYVYLDGREVYHLKWNDIAPTVDASSDVAVGFNMWVDYQADVDYSNYSISFDSNYVAEFVNNH